MGLSLRLNDKSTLLLVKVQQQALSEASIPLEGSACIILYHTSAPRARGFPDRSYS